MPSNKTIIEVQGVKLALSNLNKVYYPLVNFTKEQVIDYYIRIAPVLLPHLAGRPLTLKRYPNGVTGNFFYQKQCPARPAWVTTTPVWSDRHRKYIDFCIVNDLPSLIWAANLASLELHPSLSKAPAIETPTMVVFDLDPGPPATILDCVQVAFWLRELFENLELASFPKTSGSKGLQVYVPLNTPTDYTRTKAFAHSAARLLERRHPNKVVSKMRKTLRTGKVLVDWSQNDIHKTTVCVYSLRAKPMPTVSTPVTWEELARAQKAKDPGQLTFTCQQVLERVKKHGDLFAPVLTLRQKLPVLD